MIPQIGGLKHSLSYPSNLQLHCSRISLSDLTSAPLSTFSTNSPRTESDDSTQTIFNPTSNFNNSDVETLDEFLDSDPSPSFFSFSSFQPLASQLPNESSTAPSSYTDAFPILSPMSSDQHDPASIMTDY